MKSFGRRTFLRTTSVGAVGLGLVRLGALPAACSGEKPEPPVATAVTPYGDWRDVYREKWTWDRVVRGTHNNVNCVSTCAWNLYVREGIVWREEQAGSYDDGCAGCPDFNPRGCQKGACASELLIGATRLRYPLVRVGEREEGRWKRVSWNEALDQVAEGLVDAVAERGGDGVIAELGPEIDYGPHTAAMIRFFRMLGGPITDSMAMIGDVAFGGTITLGTPHTAGSADDWFRSDYLVLWAFNPVSTRIPDAHFLTEARYRGARVVSIAPDYNPSTVHADLWLNPRPGTDAALALAAVQVILDEELHDEAYLRQQTDLPFLVREETGRFLRQSDLEVEGSRDVFYVRDVETGRFVPAPGTTGSEVSSLDWGDVIPALEGRFAVHLGDERLPFVETVATRLRRRLDAEYRPEQVAGITGVPADTIRRFARELAGAKSALILSQYGSCKFYHGDLLQRAQILLASVTGNLGRPGGGWHSGAFIGMEGMAVLGMQRDLGLIDLVVLAARSFFRSSEENLADFSRYFVPSGLWHAVHGELAETMTEAAYGDPMLPEGSAPHLREALERNWFPIHPEKSPSFLLSSFGNVLRHSRSGRRLFERLWPKIDTAVSIDFRMSETALASDVVLPAAGWYEKIGLKYIPANVPYVTLGDRAVEPVDESKPEWEIFWRLSEAVARKARERGVDRYRDYLGVERRLGALHEAFTDGGRFGASDEEALADLILRVSSASKGIDLADLRSSGHRRIRGLGTQGGTNGIYSDYDEREPIVPLRWFVEEKRPWPTLTGRQQFYVDHPWFLELDEALPCHKDPPRAGGDYPLVLSGGHTRWSIHAMWRDHAFMLRLQRGEPVVLLGVADARTRSIRDHDPVRIYNDLGEVVARAKVVPAFPAGFTTVYHAWEPYQFRSRLTHQDLSPAPMKVTQLAADYGHLGWAYAHYEPGQVDRDTRVEIQRIH